MTEEHKLESFLFKQISWEICQCKASVAHCQECLASQSRFFFLSFHCLKNEANSRRKSNFQSDIVRTGSIAWSRSCLPFKVVFTFKTFQFEYVGDEFCGSTPCWLVCQFCIKPQSISCRLAEYRQWQLDWCLFDALWTQSWRIQFVSFFQRHRWFHIKQVNNVLEFGQTALRKMTLRWWTLYNFPTLKVYKVLKVYKFFILCIGSNSKKIGWPETGSVIFPLHKMINEELSVSCRVVNTNCNHIERNCADQSCNFLEALKLLSSS